MELQNFQTAELRDENNDIVQEGAYGRKTPLTTGDNQGWIDFVMNNLEWLKANGALATDLELAKADIEELSNTITALDEKAAGVMFDGVSSAGTRLALATTMQWEKSTDKYAGKDDFPEKLNCYNTYEVLVKDGEIVAYEGSYNFDQYKDDDEYNADVFVMFPKGYAKRFYDGDGKEYRYISDSKISGYGYSPMHYVEGKEYEAVGITKYGICNDGSGGLCSRSGKQKLINNSWANFNTKAIAKGWSGAMTIHEAMWLQHLMTIKYANYNVQNVVGSGVSNDYVDAVVTVAQTSANSVIVSNANAAKFAIGDVIYISGQNDVVVDIQDYDTSNKRIYTANSYTTTTSSHAYRGVHKSGRCDSVLGLDGEIVDGTTSKKSVLTLGIENFFANDWKLLGGAFRVNQKIYINPKPASASAWPSSEADAIEKGWIMVTDSLPATSGYIQQLGYNANYPLASFPKTVGGNSSNPVGDYFYTNADVDALRIVQLGGNLSNGANCGPFCANVCSGLGYSGWIGGALGVFRPSS